MVFNSEVRGINEQQMCSRIIHYAHNIVHSRQKFSKANVGRFETFIGWSFPIDDWIKCNIDGACKEGGQRIGCGGAFRDSFAKWLGGFKRNLGVGSVLSAELCAILTCLETAWSKGFKKFWIENDSLTAITLIKRGYAKDHQYFGLIKSISNLCKNSWHVHFMHTNREGNRLVDILVNDGATGSPGLILLDSPPSHCFDVLMDDSSGVSILRMVPSRDGNFLG